MRLRMRDLRPSNTVWVRLILGHALRADLVSVEEEVEVDDSRSVSEGWNSANFMLNPFQTAKHG